MAKKKQKYKSTSTRKKTKGTTAKAQSAKSSKTVRVLSIIVSIGIILFYLIAPETASRFFGISSGKGIVTDGFVIQNKDDAYPEINFFSDAELIEHKYYSVGYSKDLKDPYWVAYILTKQMVKRHTVNRDNEEFTRDPAVHNNYAISSDYTNSGYDRGHMCPAGDMNFGQDAMTQSFYMANITPQKPGLNRKIWKDLEEQVRDWAVDNDSIYIITGAIYSSNPKRIGNDDVAIPDKLYKVIADISAKNGYKAVAFIFDNKDYNNNENFMDYAMSVDDLETITNIDFFPNYQSQGVDEIEATFDKNLWK